MGADAPDIGGSITLVRGPQQLGGRELDAVGRGRIGQQAAGKSQLVDPELVAPAFHAGVGKGQTDSDPGGGGELEPVVGAAAPLAGGAVMPVGKVGGHERMVRPFPLQRHGGDPAAAVPFGALDGQPLGAFTEFGPETQNVLGRVGGVLSQRR
jgi:hypothetical protein